MKSIIFTLIFTVISSHAIAENITFTTIDKNAFQSHWQLTDKEMKRYEQVMKNEGQFRYPKLTPLEVLAITAPDEVTMRYYAKKAAKDEFEAVEAQLKFAVMVTEEKTKLWNQKEAEMRSDAINQEREEAEEQEKQKAIAEIVEAVQKENAEPAEKTKEAKQK